MDLIEQIFVTVAGGLILFFIIDWIKKHLKDKVSIKNKFMEEEGNKITTETTIRNTGPLSANKGPIYLHNPNNFTFVDNRQINIFQISGSTSMITSKDLSVHTYEFSVTGSEKPSFSTSTDIITEEKKDETDTDVES